MNILISGALGHIGSKLINNLSKVKNLKKAYLIDNASSNNINVLFNLKSKNIKLNFIKGNLLEDYTLRRITDKIDVVIHLASITNAEGSFKIKKFMYENNFGIFKKICKFCKKKKSKLIHLSSTSVYGVQSNLVDEKCKVLKPQSPYADIKLMEENYLKTTKLDFVTLRLGTITGISTGMRFHTAVNKFCFNTVFKESLPIWNNAMDKYRPYLSLDDALKSIFYFVNKNTFNQGTYNVLTENYTVRQILAMIKNCNFKPIVKKVNSPILNQNSYKVSRKKLDKLGIKLNKSILKDIINTLILIKSFY